MNIGFDARMYGLKNAGIGRYVKNLLHALLKDGQADRFHILIPPESKEDFDTYPNIEVHNAYSRHYTLSEQIELAKFLLHTKLDVFHSPHYNIPIVSKVPQITTIHDLIWHKYKGSQMTTLSPIAYNIKYRGYRFLTKRAIEKSAAIITPSEYVKKQIHSYFKKADASKVSVIAEAVGDSFQAAPTASYMPNMLKNKKYIVYTGSAYPHKNCNMLIDVISLLKDTLDVHLTLISARNIFSKRVMEYASVKKMRTHVHQLGFLSDSEVKAVYKNAIALTHPSLEEGFGLTGLEAMSVGLPVIASSNTCLQEVYQNAAIYADPRNASEWAVEIKKLIDKPKFRDKLAHKGIKHAQKFSWQKAALKTRSLYRQYA